MSDQGKNSQMIHPKDMKIFLAAHYFEKALVTMNRRLSFTNVKFIHTQSNIRSNYFQTLEKYKTNPKPNKHMSQ